MAADPRRRAGRSGPLDLAFLAVIVAFALFGSTDKLPTSGVQWGVLGWLGLIASGLGYFL